MWWILGALVALIYSATVLPTDAGAVPKIAPTLWPILFRGMVMLPVGRRKCLHVHHWILYGTIWSLVPLPSVVQGFVAAMTIQGIKYSDRFQIIEASL